MILTDPDPTLRDIAIRTVKIAALVTIIDALIAFPLAYYMTRVAGAATRRLLLLAILMPLFSSYLVRVYAWRLILDDQGALSWTLEKLGLGGVHLGFSETAVLITFVYAWLPFMVLPVYGALERVPSGLLEASSDLGGRGFTTFRRVVLPLALPGVVAGSIFTFSLTLGDFLTPILVGNTQFIGNVIYADVGNAGNLPAAAAYAMVPIAIMAVYLLIARAPRRLREPLMERRPTRIALRIWAVLVVLFLYIPIGIIFLYAFNPSVLQAWPITGLSTRWFGPVFRDTEIRAAFVLSLKAASLASLIAILLGSAAAFAVARFRFFGRESVSLLLVLPIALPGVVTGIALNSFIQISGIPFSLWTIVIGHGTFCIVVVYNNVIARLRRMQYSLEEASMDLGADGWQTFRYVLLPHLSTALVAGGLLAFALSFDEVIVTFFTSGSLNTLPIWILGNLRNVQRLPEVNVVAMLVILITVVPVYLAQRLMQASGGVGPR